MIQNEDVKIHKQQFRTNFFVLDKKVSKGKNNKKGVKEQNLNLQCKAIMAFYAVQCYNMKKIWYFLW